MFGHLVLPDVTFFRIESRSEVLNCTFQVRTCSLKLFIIHPLDEVQRLDHAFCKRFRYPLLILA
jgi:hypothetical protein